MIRPNISTAVGLFPTPPVTRFAPSPTGYLHLGHVVNAIYVWGVAQALGGSVLLRIEDHDRIRSRPEYEAALIEDLRWLGCMDLPITRPGLPRQSDRATRYDEALRRLRQVHHVYTCNCSRSDIAGERYGGRCRDRRVPEGPGTGLRVQFAPGAETFEDLLLGRMEQRPADESGDLLIRDRDGHWTYQFAVTVDDIEHGVTLVIRGADLLSSTGRQLRLGRMLREAGVHGPAGSRQPVYLHHPLLYDEDGRKLSKSTGATGVRALRDAGLSPAQVIGRAAAAVRLQPSPEPLVAADLGSLVDQAQHEPDQQDTAAQTFDGVRVGR